MVKTYNEKLEEIIAQLFINNDSLKLYESIDIIRAEEKQKASHSKNDLPNGGGEGGI